MYHSFLLSVECVERHHHRRSDDQRGAGGAGHPRQPVRPLLPAQHLDRRPVDGSRPARLFGVAEREPPLDRVADPGRLFVADGRRHLQSLFLPTRLARQGPAPRRAARTAPGTASAAGAAHRTAARLRRPADGVLAIAGTVATGLR